MTATELTMNLLRDGVPLALLLDLSGMGLIGDELRRRAEQPDRPGPGVAMTVLEDAALELAAELDRDHWRIVLALRGQSSPMPRDPELASLFSAVWAAGRDAVLLDFMDTHADAVEHHLDWIQEILRHGFLRDTAAGLLLAPTPASVALALAS